MEVKPEKNWQDKDDIYELYTNANFKYWSDIFIRVTK